MDYRIGKGDTPPTLTIRGKPAPHNVTESRNLGHGYYCVVDVVKPNNLNELIAELKAIVEKMNEPKRKSRKPVAEISGEGNDV